MITQEDRFDRAGIQAAAERYRVCPFELSLDLSEWMETERTRLAHRTGIKKAAIASEIMTIAAFLIVLWVFMFF